MEDRPSGPGEPVVRLGHHPYRSLPVDEQPTPLDFLDCLGCAAITLDDTGAATHANTRAKLLLGRDLMLRSGQLIAADRASDRLLQELVQSATNGSLNHNVLLPPVMVKRSEGRSVVVQILPASSLAANLGGKSERSCC